MSRVKVGTLTLQAVGLCRSPDFRLYLDWKKRRQHGMTLEQLPDGTHTEQDARDAICSACGIETRGQLGCFPDSDAMFERIRADYTRWCQHEWSKGDPAWL